MITERQYHLTVEKQALLKGQTDWDMIIIGGGITGAGILKVASQSGLNALLLEQKDFAWGSSSRSSKMIHGGLRYIAEGQLSLTLESVRERRRLLKEAPQLVTSQNFMVSHYRKQFPAPWMFNLLLSIYDLLGRSWQHKKWSKTEYQFLAPGIKTNDLIGGSQFTDAMTDDARLVLRLLQEAQSKGAHALNYVKVNRLVKKAGRVVGVSVSCGERQYQVNSKVVVNATGAWSNQLLGDGIKPIKLRPLRGSHLVFNSWRLPVASAISVLHPEDRRPVQIFPWQNVTLVGTTDIEHNEDLSRESAISHQELAYLLDCVNHQFPSAGVKKEDIVSTFAGVRPVVANGGLVSPSKEKREHSICYHPGLVNVSGGKLTTFRVIAQEIFQKLVKDYQFGNQQCFYNDFSLPVFEPCQTPVVNNIPDYILQNISGRYGKAALEMLTEIEPGQFELIGYTNYCWAELIWAMRYEQVNHLDDLMLRRTRIGNLLPGGGINQMERIKALCIEIMGWSESHWEKELAGYLKLWKTFYSLPE